MLRGDLEFFVGQIGHLGRSDESPVIPDRAALVSPPTQTDGLHGYPRDPDGGEQVAAAAAHDRVTAEQETTTAREHNRLRTKPGDGDSRDHLATHTTNGTPLSGFT